MFFFFFWDFLHLLGLALVSFPKNNLCVILFRDLTASLPMAWEKCFPRSPYARMWGFPHIKKLAGKHQHDTTVDDLAYSFLGKADLLLLLGVGVLPAISELDLCWCGLALGSTNSFLLCV